MITCKSCGKRIEPGNAYGDGRGGGPWHRLCVPQNPDADSWEQRVRQEMRALEAANGTSPMASNDRGQPHLQVVK